MFFKVIKFGGIAVLLLLLLLVVVLQIGSSLTMDRDRLHSQASMALPALSEWVTDGAHQSGLVNITTDNGMTFRARVAGFDDTTRPLVILLHGFPVTSAMWIDLIQPLADSGLRVVAFDQRGYSPGARPDAVGAYAVNHLIDDVFAVADVVGEQRFHLVGHDWGAAVGWGAVLARPERVISWTGLSIAHPQAFQEALQNDPDQQSRSRYFALFQTPWLPETLFTFNDLALLRGAYAGMAAEKTTEYAAVFSEPGALSAGLNWYRAMDQGLRQADVDDTNVSIPTLFIWGNRDGAVGRAAIDAMATFMHGPYRNIELDAGHWLFVDQRDAVVEAVVAHIQTYR